MSWGIRITFFYVGFVALILTLVFTSMHHKEDLVSKDYYQQELRYQDRIDALANSNELADNITHELTAQGIVIEYPSSFTTSHATGEIYFFRPSDAEKDFKISMQGSNGTQLIDRIKFAHGLYKMQLSWKQDGKQYFKEEVIFVP